MASKDRLLADVISRAEANGVELVLDGKALPHTLTRVRTWRGVPVLVSATVTTQPIRSGFSYYTALHEIGHVSCAFADSLAGAGELLREARAWDLALSRAIVKPTPRVWQMIRSSWTSYVIAEARLGLASGVIRHVPDALSDFLDSAGAAVIAEADRDWYLRVWGHVKAQRPY